MNEGPPIWDTLTLERPGQVLEVLAMGGVNRLLAAYDEAIMEMDDELRGMVSPEAWRLYIRLCDLKDDYSQHMGHFLIRLMPVLVRNLDAHTLLAAKSFEELLETAITEAGLSPKKREEIMALRS